MSLKLFCSYAHANREQVERLLADLVNVNYIVWYDQKLYGGSKWWTEILEQIEECDAFLFMLSPESLDSVYCRTELDYALALNKPVLPVLVSQNIELPPSLANLHYVVAQELADKGPALRVAASLTMLLKEMLHQSLESPVSVPRPNLPRTKIDDLREKVRGLQDLNPQQQLQLAHSIKDLMLWDESPRIREQAHELLQQMSKSSHLTRGAAEEIADKISDSPSVPESGQGKKGVKRFSFIYLASGVVLLVLLIAAFLLLNSDGKTDPPVEPEGTIESSLIEQTDEVSTQVQPRETQMPTAEPSTSTIEAETPTPAMSSTTVHTEIGGITGVPVVTICNTASLECTTSQLTEVDGVWVGMERLSVGNYQYKVVSEQSSDESSELKGVTLDSPTSVSFYFDPQTGWFADDVNYLIATLPGTFSSELGCEPMDLGPDWNPACLRAWLQDADNDGIYRWTTRSILPGEHEVKVAINLSWDESYGIDGETAGSNIPFTVHETGETVEFSFDSATKILTIVAGSEIFSTRDSLDASVIFVENFDGTVESLSSQWIISGQTSADPETGDIILTGNNNWDTLFARNSTILTRQAVLLLFQYSPGTMAIYLSKGRWENNNYRRWELTGGGEEWSIMSRASVDGEEITQTYFTERLTPNTDYYLLLGVGLDGNFYAYVWERYNPDHYVIAVTGKPTQDEWRGVAWSVFLESYSGTIRLYKYMELVFEEDIVMPQTPPNVDELNQILPTAGVTTDSGGSAIVFHSNRDGNWEIYQVSLDGSESERLTNNRIEDYNPMWSPDGNHLIFTSFQNGNMEIYLMGEDGSDPVNLTNHEAWDYSAGWSPDGSQILFESYRDPETGKSEICIMDADGSNQINLTNHPADDLTPAWSPDGNKIAFSTDRDGNSEIYLMNVDGSDPVNLTNHEAFDTMPAWSPDGSRIAFVSSRDGNWEIYLMNIDGSDLVRLTDTQANDWNPIWSPDGKYIAFASERHGNPEIYIMNADGSDVRRVTDNPEADSNPGWRP